MGNPSAIIHQHWSNCQSPFRSVQRRRRRATTANLYLDLGVNNGNIITIIISIIWLTLTLTPQPTPSDRNKRGTSKAQGRRSSVDDGNAQHSLVSDTVSVSDGCRTIRHETKRQFQSTVLIQRFNVARCLVILPAPPHYSCSTCVQLLILQQHHGRHRRLRHRATDIHTTATKRHQMQVELAPLLCYSSFEHSPRSPRIRSRSRSRNPACPKMSDNKASPMNK